MKCSLRRMLRKAGSLALALGLVLAGGGSCSERKKKPSVILVIIDTLPASHVSAYGYPRSTTTFLDQLAKDGLLFRHAVAASPWTLPSIASILTGLYPSRHQAGIHLDPWTMKDRRLAQMRPEVMTLAELFKNHGYQTIGFFNNPFVHPDFGLNKGFEVYDYVGGDNLQIRPATQVVNGAVNWLAEHGRRPFFMVLHFFDPHLAYDPPLVFATPYIAEYKGKLTRPFNPELEEMRSGRLTLSEDDKKFIVGLYDGEVAAVDAELGRFISYLKKQGIYDPAMIIVTSDHGEEFWEHGGFEHGHTLYRELLEVPLVIKFPGGDFAGQTVEEYVSLLDIFPTLAEMMKWPLAFPVDGMSLYPRAGRLQVLPHTLAAENVHYGPQLQAFYSENVKLIVDTETGELVIFDLKNDPAETKNVLGQLPLPQSVKTQVQKIAGDLQTQLQKQTPQAANLDQETVKKLKSLGYIK